MLDAFIIDRLKQEKEPPEEGWQPIPLPLERHPVEEEDQETERIPEKTERMVVIRL